MKTVPGRRCYGDWMIGCLARQRRQRNRSLKLGSRRKSGAQHMFTDGCRTAGELTEGRVIVEVYPFKTAVRVANK